MYKKKTALYIAGGAIGLIIIFFLLKFITDNQFSNNIPEIPNSNTLSIPVKKQISEAHDEAYRNPSAENLGMLGMVYHSSANYSQAAQCYELAIKRSKSGWIWNYYHGYLSMELGKSEAAIENFNSVIEKNPAIDLAWYYVGQEYKNLGENELAEKAFEKIILKKNITSDAKATTRNDHFPLRTYAMYDLSRIYFDTGHTDLAEETLKELIQKNYLFGPAYRLLGNIYNIKGNISLGKQYTVRANDLLNFSPPVDTLIDRLALLSRSELYLLKKIDEAERSMHSDWAVRLVNHGLQYMPDNQHLLSKAIRVYLWKRLNKKAIALTDQHISYFRENFNELRNTGLLFYQKGLYPQAIKYWNLALDLKPEEIKVQEYLAKCFYATGEKQKVHKLVNELLEKNQDNPEVLADITSLLLQFGEKEKAVGHLTKLKQLIPSNPTVQKIAGEVAEANGDTQEAITMYESSFKGDPEDLQTIRKLGRLLTEQKMWNKSLSLYSKALKYHPNNPELLAKLGEFLINCPDPSIRNIEKGKEYSERAFTYYDCPPDILVSAGSHLAYAYAMLGEKQKAITTISKAINIGRRQNISSSYQAKLENLYKGIQNIEN